jgi:hypothetical protein
LMEGGDVGEIVWLVGKSMVWARRRWLGGWELCGCAAWFRGDGDGIFTV